MTTQGVQQKLGEIMKYWWTILLLLVSSPSAEFKVSADEFHAAHLSQVQSPISTAVAVNSSNPRQASDQIPHQPELSGALIARAKWIFGRAVEHEKVITLIVVVCAFVLSFLSFLASRKSNSRIAAIEEESLKIQRDNEQRVYRDTLAELIQLNTQWRIAMNKLEIVLLAARGVRMEMPPELANTILKDGLKVIDASVAKFAKIKEEQKKFFDENEDVLKWVGGLEKIEFKAHKKLQELGATYKKAAHLINSGASDIEQVIELLRKKARGS